MNGIAASPTEVRQKSDSFPTESTTCKVLM